MTEQQKRDYFLTCAIGSMLQEMDVEDAEFMPEADQERFRSIENDLMPDGTMFTDAKDVGIRLFRESLDRLLAGRTSE